MSYLTRYGVTERNNELSTTFESLLPNIFDIEFERCSPSQYISRCWQRYKSKQIQSSSDATIFTYLVSTLLIREGIIPFLRQAKVSCVPNITYDFLFCTSKLQLVNLDLRLNPKSSYKQADLEAVALKYVHRRAQSHLVTLDVKEGHNTAKKLETGDLMGLDSVIIATEPAMDELIEKLKQLPLIKPKPIEIVSASLLISAENIPTQA